MGRGGRSSGGGRSFPSAPRPAASRSPAAKPARKSTPPAPVQTNSGGLFGGSLRQTLTDGLAWGFSNAVAHRVMDTLLGPRTIRVEEVAAEAAAKSPALTSTVDACGTHFNAFQECLNSNSGEISKCQFYMDLLADCKKNAADTVLDS
ncbi:hypothetical protein ABFS82_14G100100 [Erythranthe guttata]